jgi:hypothetical protein
MFVLPEAVLIVAWENGIRDWIHNESVLQKSGTYFGHNLFSIIKNKYRKQSNNRGYNKFIALLELLGAKCIVYNIKLYCYNDVIGLMNKYWWFCRFVTTEFDYIFKKTLYDLNQINGGVV